MAIEPGELYEGFVRWVLARPGGADDFLAFVRQEVLPSAYDAGVGRADAQRLDRIASWASSTEHGAAAAEVIRILNNGQEPLGHGAPLPASCPHCQHRVEWHTVRVGEDTGVCASCNCTITEHRWVESSFRADRDICTVDGCPVYRITLSNKEKES